MIPTFIGRIQTRIFLVLFVALPWTFLIAFVLPHAGGTTFTDLYPTLLWALGVILVLGVVLWEPFYYLLQSCRWEKDWPAMFFMLELIPEAILAWYIIKAIGPDGADTGASLSTFLVHIITTWVVMWLFVLGPIKVLFIRWRFNGGRMFW